MTVTWQVNLTGEPRGDEAVVVAAWYVTRAWSKIDPQVESLLIHV